MHQVARRAQQLEMKPSSEDKKKNALCSRCLRGEEEHQHRWAGRAWGPDVRLQRSVCPQDVSFELQEGRRPGGKHVLYLDKNSILKNDYNNGIFEGEQHIVGLSFSEPWRPHRVSINLHLVFLFYNWKINKIIWMRLFSPSFSVFLLYREKKIHVLTGFFFFHFT